MLALSFEVLTYCCVALSLITLKLLRERGLFIIVLLVLSLVLFFI
jgi:hypothetical protein